MQDLTEFYACKYDAGIFLISAKSKSVESVVCMVPRE